MVKKYVQTCTSSIWWSLSLVGLHMLGTMSWSCFTVTTSSPCSALSLEPSVMEADKLKWKWNPLLPTSLGSSLIPDLLLHLPFFVSGASGSPALSHLQANFQKKIHLPMNPWLDVYAQPTDLLFFLHAVISTEHVFWSRSDAKPSGLYVLSGAMCITTTLFFHIYMWHLFPLIVWGLDRCQMYKIHEATSLTILRQPETRSSKSTKVS